MPIKNLQRLLNADEKYMELFLKKLIVRYGIKQGMNYAMGLRKDLQRALSYFSENNGSHEEQIKFLWLIETIFRIMGREYVAWARKEIVKEKPWMIHYPQKVKILANGWWDRYVKKHGAY